MRSRLLRGIDAVAERKEGTRHRDAQGIAGDEKAGRWDIDPKVGGERREEARQ